VITGALAEVAQQIDNAFVQGVEFESWRQRVTVLCANDHARVVKTSDVVTIDPELFF
jgi:hypothetical protein